MLAEVFLAAEQPLERLVSDIIGVGEAAGRTAPGIDRAHEADLLVAGAVGLGLDVLHGRRSLADVRTVLDYHLGRIFPDAIRTPRPLPAATPLNSAPAAQPSPRPNTGPSTN